jgi:type IV secretory pathway VirJ component
VTVIGYSMGADVLPFALNRMSAATRSRVTAAAAIAPGMTAQFEFHLTNWLGSDHDGLPIAPEVARLRVPFTCIYADGDRGGICPDLDTTRYRVVNLPGGHHFNGDYARLAQELLMDAPVK